MESPNYNNKLLLRVVYDLGIINIWNTILATSLYWLITFVNELLVIKTQGRLILLSYCILISVLVCRKKNMSVYHE